MNNNETKRVQRILKRFRRRKISLISKADNLYRLFGADVLEMAILASPKIEDL